MRFFGKSLLVLSMTICIASTALAADLSIGCAANFTSAMKELAALYEQESGQDLQLAFGSTGMLYGQIKEGAPYDLFFAADEKRPALLHEEGLAHAPKLYAMGKVVLWTMRSDLAVSSWKEALLAAPVKHVGIANPKTAPYGQRSVEAMQAAGVLETVKPKLSYGKSVGISFQYAYSGAADLSFIALSQALAPKGAKGSWWPIPEAETVRQAACILKRGNATTAGAFLDWLGTTQARTIITNYGYE